MLDNLNHDVILHLLKFCNYNNALALKNTNSEFNTIIKKFTVIQKKLEGKIKSRLNLYTFLSYKDSHLHKCLNEQCCNKNEFIECYSQMINLNRCMGLTRLYFPQKIVPKQNSNLQSVKPIESSEYKNAKYLFAPNTYALSARTKIIEAMSCGTIVFTYEQNIKGIFKYMKNFKNILIAKNSDMFIKQFKIILKNKALQKKISKNAKILYHKHYRPSLIVKKNIDLILK